MTIFIKTAQGWRPWVAAHVVCDNHNNLQGVYRPVSRLAVLTELAIRADVFCAHLEGAVNNRAEDAPFFRGNELTLPIYGAFGEKL